MKAGRTSRPRGVTLVELVVVLTIIGVVASVAATMVGRVVAGQQDNRGRLLLGQAADGALTRVGTELERALPNSLRLTSNGAGTWIEWVPVLDAARYRQAADTASGSPGDVLDFGDPADNAFDIIGTALATPAAGSQIVFGNLGTSEADAYAGSSRRAGLSVSAAGRHVAFTAAGPLPQTSSGARFFIVGTPITLACNTAADGTLQLVRYSGYGWLAAQPASSVALAGASRGVLLGQLRSCSASYGTALANIGLLNLRLGAGDGLSNAGMDFMQQIAVDNTP